MLKNIRQLLPEGRPPHGFGYGKKAAKEAAYAAQQKRRREKRMAIAVGAASAAAVMTWTLWQNTALMLREISVTDDSIPEAFSGLRIAQISDFHNSVYGEENEKLVRLVKQSSPDLIVVTGDFIDSRRTDTKIAADLIDQIISVAPVYYVAGNHESRIPGEYRELKKSMKAEGVHILQNEAEYIEKGGEKIQIIGVNDPDFCADKTFSQKFPPEGQALSRQQQREKNAKLISEEIKALRDEDCYSVLLSHRPELFDAYAACGVNFVFSGHAHGGQFRLPLLGGLFAPGQGFFPRYDSGLYREKNTGMVVSRGIGGSIVPLRFNNRPEIVVTEIVRGKKGILRT